MMLKIHIDVIPHEKQRYETVGDWFYGSDGTWHIKVSSMDNWKYEFLVALHELVEMAFCRIAGVSEKEVTDFDVAYEAARADNDNSEPGDDPRAPYFWQHTIASTIEMVAARIMGVDWAHYEESIYAL